MMGCRAARCVRRRSSDPSNCTADQPRCRTASTRTASAMPLARRSTSGANCFTPAWVSPQYRYTIAIAAPPQSDSVCGRYGTSSVTDAVSVDAASRFRSIGLLDVNDEQDREQQDDDERRRGDRDGGGAADELLVHLTCRIRRPRQVGALQRVDGGDGPCEIESDFRGGVTHFRPRQRFTNSAAVRVFGGKVLFDCGGKLTRLDDVLLTGECRSERRTQQHERSGESSECRHRNLLLRVHSRLKIS